MLAWRMRGLVEHAEFGCFDLEAEVFRVDTALREAAGDEPEAGLRRALEHVAQFLFIAKAPDRANPLGDRVAEQCSHHMVLTLVAGGQHDQVSRQRAAVAYPGAFRDKLG